MTDQDRERFLRAMLTLAETFGETPSEPRLEAYFRVLSSFTIEEVERMVSEAMRGCRYFPKPVELIEQLEGTVEDQAATAWLTLEDTMRRAGQYATVEFRDQPIIAHAVTALWGTWPDAVEAFGRAEEPEWQGQRKEFFAVYRMLRRRSLAVLILAGLHELQNRHSGQVEIAERQYLERVVIGRDQKALPAPQARRVFGINL